MKFLKRFTKNQSSNRKTVTANHHSSFLEIKNKGVVSRKYYELIGATNKRERWNDASVIGNKGSGAKLAVVPVLRLGLQVAVSSKDSLGEYILRYDTEEANLGDRTTQQIIFKYDGDGSFPSQLTLDAFQDWDKPIGDDDKKIFKALREYVCNAWDEDKKLILKEVGDVHQAKPGTTAIFLTMTDEIQQILANPTRYFKILSDCKPLVSKKYVGAIYPKSEPGMTRLFSQGVLADCKKHEWYSTVFDYSLDDKYLLSEERIIKDLAAFVDGIGNLLSTVDDPEIVIKLFQSAAKEQAELEIQALERIKRVPSQTAAIWKIAWQLHFGAKAVISGYEKQIDQDAESRGFTIIRSLPNALERFLKRCGITCATDVVPRASREKGEKPAYELIELNEKQQSRFNQTYSLFLRYYPQAKKFSVFFYRPTDWRMEDSAGYCGIGDKQYKEIWIAEKSLESVQKILTVLVHEGRHCLKQAGDYDRKFTQAADLQLVAMILANSVPPCKNEWHAKVVQQRGVLVPRRFIGQNVHILINGTEIRFKFGQKETSCQMLTILSRDIKGMVSHNRRVTSFQKFGCVFVPAGILKQLPQTITMDIQ